jgi:broad specificity phosphatase PhoE
MLDRATTESPPCSMAQLVPPATEGGEMEPRSDVEVFLVRHGETAWSLSGQHTGRTDLALTENGRRRARLLAPLLAQAEISHVLASPLRRARETCELAGLADRMQVDPDLVEWNYGAYEGLTQEEIARTAPGWVLFADGCPGGESPDEVGARADRVLGRVRSLYGRVALFAHGHFFRVLAARWIGLPPGQGSRFLLDTATVSVLGSYRDIPAVKRWNVPVESGRSSIETR